MSDQAQGRPDTQARPDSRGYRNGTGAGIRGVLGIVALVVAVGTIGAATVVPGFGMGVAFEPPVLTVVPEAAPQERVCAGPLVRQGGDFGADANSIASLGEPTLRSSPDSASISSLDSDGLDFAPVSLELGAGTGSGDLSASQTQSAERDDLSGFAAAECGVAGDDSWLVGGSTVIGRTTLLSLANPGGVDATANVEVFAETVGQPAAASGIIVPARTQRLVSLAALAPGIQSPVVHVSTTRGDLEATLQQSIVRTLAPGGAEIITAAAEPARDQFIPGFVVTAGESVEEAAGEAGANDLTAVLRLLAVGTPESGAPSGDQAAPEQGLSATITVTPEESGAVRSGPTTFEVPFQVGVVTDVPLLGLPDGAYSVRIESPVSFVASARASTIGTAGPSDFAWTAAATPLSSDAAVSVAGGATPTLHLGNPTTRSVTVTVASVLGDEEPIVVTLAPGATASVGIGENRDLLLRGADGIVGTISWLGDGASSSQSISPAPDRPTELRVYG